MSMQMLKLFPAAHQEKITCVAFDPAHNQIFVAAQSPNIIVWNTKSNSSQPVAVMKGHKGAVTGLVYFSGMGLVISSSLDGTLVVWDDRFKVLQVLNARKPIRCMAWNQKQTIIGIGQTPAMQFYKMIDVLQLVAYRRIRQREINIGGDCMPLPVDIKPDLSHHIGSRLLAKTLLKQCAHKPDWDVLKKPLIKPITQELSGATLGHTDAVVAIAITDTGLVMSGSLDCSLCVFDLNRPTESVRKIEMAHDQGIVSVAHDVVNNWFVSGGFDGAVKVWSGDGKPLEAFYGVSDDIASAVYVPFTHSYWQVNRNGNINVYDARAPARITELVHESNGLMGQNVDRLLVPPHSDCLFATTQDKGLIMYRYNHHGAYRTFQRHQGWIEAMISIQIPAVHDTTGKVLPTSVRAACAADVQEYKATAPSLRQQWLRWLENRKKSEKEGNEGSTSWVTPRKVSMAPRHSSRGLKSDSQLEEAPTEPEECPLMQKRKTLMSQHAKEDVGEKILFTQGRGTVRLTTYKAELPGSQLKAALDQARAELQQETAEESNDGKRASIVEEEPHSLQEREGEMNEYIFTACATGVVHQWALDKQIQCDNFQIVESHEVSKNNVLALAYCKELNWILAAGVEGEIKVISLARPQNREGMDPLPTVLYGHTQKITALVVLKNYVAASAGHDRQIRFWDLHTMTEIESGRKEEAHQAPICRLSYSEQRNEMGTVALENVAKVWDVSRPTDSRIRFQLETPGEISQLNHIPWKAAWCTMSTDGVARLWNDENGELAFQFNYNGGLVQSVLVDAEERVILATMQDAVIRVFNLSDPIPLARYLGHTELVTAIVPLHTPKGYASCSWDKSLNIWHGHVVDAATSRHHSKLLHCHKDFFNELHGSSKTISEFEKKNPKFSPASLNEPAVSQEVLDRTIAKNNVLPVLPPIILSSMAQKLNDQLNLLDTELLLDTGASSEIYM